MSTTVAASSAASAILDRLACPQCRGRLDSETHTLHCVSCGVSYPLAGGILDLRPPAAREKAEAGAWTRHWSQENQQTLSQRFFSVYRKALFARTVAYFLDRYFPRQGVFIEAGSGTSETSMRVDKCAGGRRLVAVDLIRPVLERCHPVMDARVCADIFHLPFLDNSLDGIWNVGVMEHFTHPQIDQILREFGRALKPGGRVILLWPATFSIPQKMLRVCEWFINFRQKQGKFQFHPDEISQIRSIRQGREVLIRNGFRPVHIDPGFRSLMAFETIIGEKDPTCKN